MINDQGPFTFLCGHWSERTLIDFGKIPSDTKDLDSITSERTLFDFGKTPSNTKDLNNSITYI